MALPSRSATRTRRPLTLRRAVAAGLLTGLVAAAGASAAPHWQGRPPLPIPQQEVASTALNGELYVAGGFTSLSLITDAHWRFDPRSGSWERLTELPEPVHHLHAVPFRGRIHYLGGESGLDFRPTGEHLIFDPLVNSFAYGTPLPFDRIRGAAAVGKHGGKIYIAGGILRNGRASAMLDVYDPDTQSWRALPDMPSAREHVAGAFVGDRFYVIAGRNEHGMVGATEAYDVSKRRWLTNLPPIPTRRDGLGVAALGKYIYAIGGEGAGRAHNEVERLNIRTKRWVAQPPLPTPRHGFEAATLRGKLWLAGGATVEGYSPSVASEVFVP